jgi:hypothetical protein
MGRLLGVDEEEMGYHFQPPHQSFFVNRKQLKRAISFPKESIPFLQIVILHKHEVPQQFALHHQLNQLTT